VKRRLIIPVAAVGLAVWETTGRTFFRVGLLVSVPSRLVGYGSDNLLRLLTDLGYTSSVTLVGFLVALASGGAAAVAAFRYPALHRTTVHGLQLFQVIPVLVFAPFVTMVFGVGFVAHVVITFLVGVFPFTTLVLDALNRIPEPYLDLVRLHQIGFLVALRRVYLPLSMPAVYAAARVTVSVCVVGATVAEFTGSRWGLGRNVFEGAIRLEPELLLLSTLAIALIGSVGVAVLRTLERQFIRWKP
jgi:NitT/TauT family transport system permease protein